MRRKKPTDAIQIITIITKKGVFYANSATEKNGPFIYSKHETRRLIPMKKGWKDVLFGFLIGGTMSVPGVSGGTTAIALGCYESILSATATLRERNNLYYLLRIFLGGVAGFFLMAGLVKESFRILPLTMTMLFCASAGTGLFLLGKEAVRGGITLNGVLFFLLGVGTVLAVDKLPPAEETTSPLLMMLWGIFLAAGIILPGISTSHLLLVFGLYDTVTDLFKPTEFISLIPLGLGAILGIVLLTKPLAAAMKGYPSHCKFALLGFSVGSMKALIEPCIEAPQLSYLPWFQVINGVILSLAAGWAILRMNSPKKKMKKM